MSGGAYDYLYCMVEGMADRIVQAGDTPERRRFAKHLRRVARAMHAIRWVDSCDLDRGEENAAIRAVFDPAENVSSVDGETIATVRLGAPTDADVETLRRAMVEAHQTMIALAVVPSRALSPYDASEEADAARCDFGEAARAYVAAKRARGGP